MTTLAKYRHLTQSSTPSGHFCVLAIDHRGNLRANLDQQTASPVTDDEFTQFKQQVMGYLMPYASAVLVDPAFGIGQGVVNGVISGQHGILAPIEVTDYDTHPSLREVAMMDDWSVAKIKQIGGTGVKLLLNYHPETPNAEQKHELVRQIVAECAANDIPFFLEPIVYSPDPQQTLDNVEKRRLVVKSARALSALQPDVLKMEFPIDAKQDSDEGLWRDALAELDAACSVPWALLSAGVDYATFSRQAQLACDAGASGVIVGRAVWTEAVKLQGDERDSFLKTTARQRMQELADICASSASDWRTRVQAPDTSVDWYTRI